MIIFFSTFVNAQIPDSCDSSMIAYWQFDNNLLDSFGDSDNGIWMGLEGYEDFINGRGGTFAGDDKVVIRDSSKLRFDSSFTIEMWINGGISSDGHILKKGFYDISWIVQTPPFAKIKVKIGSTLLSSNQMSLNTPYHIAIAWDANGEELKLYVNGKSVNKSKLSAYENSAGDMTIGDGFRGLIDELAIYDDDLDDIIIKMHYALGKANKNLCDQSGAAGTSTTQTTFNIKGCNFDLGESSFALAVDKCSSSNFAGRYYCDQDKIGWYTLDEGLGCAMGDANYKSDSGLEFCCPSGYFCGESGEDTGQFKCSRRLENCSSKDKEGDCLDNGCLWLPSETGEGICVESLRDYSCSYYSDADLCGQDKWNLGQTGVGTEICGTSITCDGNTDYSIPQTDCSCKWYQEAPDGQKCQLKLIGIEMFHREVPKSFECSNSYEVDQCIDGKQNLKWFSTNSTISGFDDIYYSSKVPEDCLFKAGCTSGAGYRICGEPIIKVSGFSKFSLLASTCILIIYYGFRTKRKKK